MKIDILDTTLRDGLQSPFLSLDNKSKTKIALTIEKLGIDLIEVGFPASSNEEFNFVRSISKKIKKSKICVMARLIKSDIARASEATIYAKRKRITLLIPTNKYFKHTKKDLLKSIEVSYEVAKVNFNDIAFAIQDATRISKSLLFEIVNLTTTLGARTIVLADTVGSQTPDEYGKIFSLIRTNFPGDFKLAAHCHNDLGLATANALSAIQNGAEQVDCSIGGIGERAGNTPTEEILSIIEFKKKNKFKTGVNMKLLYKTCKIFQGEFNEAVFSRNKTIFGDMIFTHKSGIHQNGILNNPKTYEFLVPEEIGYPGRYFVLGKSSGLSGVKYLIERKKIKITRDETPEKIILEIKNGKRNYGDTMFPVN